MQWNSIQVAKGTVVTAMAISVCLIFYIGNANIYKNRYSSDVAKKGKISEHKPGASDIHAYKQQKNGIEIDKQYASANPEPITPPLATRTCTQQERKKHFKDMCEKFNQQFHLEVVLPAHVKGGRNNILVSEPHKIAWCRVPKVASTTISALMNAAQRQLKSKRKMKNATIPMQLGLIRHRNRSIRSFHGYKKLLVVRNPYHRVISAFHNKIRWVHSRSPNMVEARRKIQEFEGHNITYVVNGEIFTTIKFENFLSQIALSSDDLHLNGHWTEINALCDVCADWDYILKLETLDSDINLLLDSWNVTRKLYRKVSGNFSFKEKEKAVRNDQAKMSFTSDLSLLANISEQSLNGLKQRYGRDAALFGYDVNIDTYTGTCGIQTETGDVCC